MDPHIIITKCPPLTLKKGMSFEALISQIQPQLVDSILIVKDGSELMIIKNKEEFPKNLIQEGEPIGSVYYFRSSIDDSLYAVSGEEAASLFSQSIPGGRTVASLNNDGLVLISTVRPQGKGKIVMFED